MQKLMDILGKAAERFPGLGKRLKEAEALGRWEVAVGPIIAKHSRAIRVEDAVLWVEVDHPIWKSELHHRKAQILGILNANDAKTQTQATAIKDVLFLDPRGPGARTANWTGAKSTGSVPSAPDAGAKKPPRSRP